MSQASTSIKKVRKAPNSKYFGQNQGEIKYRTEMKNEYAHNFECASGDESNDPQDDQPMTEEDISLGQSYLGRQN